MIDSQGKNLIFLISQPRSGSTLLQLLLSGNPDIATTSEPWIALHPIYSLRNNGIQTDYDSNLAVEALRDFLKQSGMDESFYRKQIASFIVSVYKKAAEIQRKKYFLDKTPRYYEIADELAEMLPEAKFITLIRNPLDVLNSLVDRKKGDWSLLEYNKRDLMVAPQKLTDFHEKYGERSCLVKYETLVREPEKTVKKLCHFLGIEYFNDLLEYDRKVQEKWNFGDQKGIKCANRAFDDSVDKWKSKSGSTQFMHLSYSYLKELGPEVVEKMGYDFHKMLKITSKVRGRSELGTIPWSVLMRDNSLLEDKIELQYYKLLLKSKYFVVMGWGLLLARKFVIFSNRLMESQQIINERGYKEFIKQILYRLFHL